MWKGKELKDRSQAEHRKERRSNKQRQQEESWTRGHNRLRDWVVAGYSVVASAASKRSDFCFVPPVVVVISRTVWARVSHLKRPPTCEALDGVENNMRRDRKVAGCTKDV